LSEGDDDQGMTRSGSTRRAILVGLTGGVAGCARSGRETARETAPQGRDPDRAATSPSAESVVDRFTARPTERAESVQVELAVSSDTELAAVTLESPRDSIEKRLAGTNDTVSATLDAPPMATSAITATIETADGATVEATRETYAREFDVLSPTRLTVGAAYQPYMGSLLRQDCMDDSQFDPIFDWQMTDPITVNGQIDYMQGHGLTSVMVLWNGSSETKPDIEHWLEHQLTHDVPLEGNVGAPKFWKWRGDDESFREKLEADLSWYADAYLSRGNLETTPDGRHLVTFWNGVFYAWNEESRATIMDEWGGYGAFVDFLRDVLTVEGREPYLISQAMRSVGVGDDEAKAYLEHFDAVTSWTQKGHEIGEWDSVLERTQRDFEQTRTWVDERDMGFVPTAFPGFDADHNDCWGGKRRLERSPERFAQVLDLALQYRTETPNKITAATWSAWAEGTQIEPGSFRGEDYGTTYLEPIEAIQRE
jgi:hypothetical protein